MQRFKNIIFDVDGLLCDTEPLHRRAFNLMLQAAGAEYQFDAEEYGRTLTGRSVFENAEYARERFALAQDAADLAAAVWALFNVLISDADNVEPMPGLDDVLNFAFAQELKMAVASSTREEYLEKMLRAINVTSTFAIRVNGSGNIKPKPAPDIYLKALKLMRAEPAETVAVEDSLSGVRAAKAAGIFVIAVGNEYTRHQDLSEANYVAQDLSDVKRYLEKHG